MTSSDPGIGDAPPLHPRTAPFSDFLVLQGRMRSRLRGLSGFSRMEVGETTVLLRAPIASFEDGIFMGVAPVGGRLLVGTYPYSRTTEIGRAIRPGLTGQYLVLARNDRGGVTVGGDCFGMVPLFLHEAEEGAILSSQLHLIAIALKEMGIAAGLDVASMAGTWFVDNSLAIQQATTGSLLAGTRMLRVGEELTTTTEGIALSDPPHVSQDPVTRDEYRDMIAAGAEEIRGNLRAVASGGRRAIAGLTGGRDSRMIFAGLVSLGLEREIQFSTRDINDADMHIATGLVSRYGGAFDADDSLYGTIPVTPEQSFDRHRSSFFGAYHDYKGVMGNDLTDRHTVSLIGGCGEVYRGFLAQNYPEEIVRRDFSREAFMETVSSHRSWANIFPEQMGEMWREALFDTMEGLQGQSVADRFEDHYFNFRNRLHFGATTMAANPGRVRFNPLMSPTLRALSHRVPLDVRRSGAIVFDTTRALDETVAYLPYAKGGPAQFSNHAFHVPSRYDDAPLSMEPDRPLWEAAAAARRGARLNVPTRRSRRPHDEALMARLFDRLEPDPTVGPLMTKKLRGRIDWLGRNRKKFYTVWLSRLAAAHDVLSYS